uniref:Uncharacterized protein n=1 Tax=Molossus molossus TaxID=27622 RepID=A0A7J8DTA1_MOLMO|nr:hypothetical protein HJG59_009156 [Molossus molossus]
MEFNNALFIQHGLSMKPLGQALSLRSGDSLQCQTSCAGMAGTCHGLSRALPLQETCTLDGGQWVVRGSIARVVIILPVPSEMVLGPPFPRAPALSTEPYKKHLRFAPSSFVLSLLPTHLFLFP